ncbi:MAG: hypothetical protein H7Z41_02475, partial [Cytophagales bacterium]|nr:hypothetical protein [Armatimonadota bacterium]
VAESDGFKSFVRDLNTKLVYDEPSRKGSSDLFKAFLADPNRYDFITTYESNAIGAAEKNPELAVIYPMPTAVAEQSVVLLSGGDWLTPEQKAGGQEFLRFLAEADSLKDGVKSRFRPANPSGEANLTGAINALKGQGFQQTYSGVELPPYEAINDAAYNWRKQVQPTAPWVRS